MVDSFFRRVWRWHFWAGLVACPVLIVLAVTGAIYTVREEVHDWREPTLRFVAPAGEPRPVSEQLAAAAAAHPDWAPTRVTVPEDRRRTTVVQVALPDGPAWAVYVNPYTAQVVGDGDPRSPFFAGVLTVHRSLYAGTAGRVAVELTTSWTVVLLVSGLYLWLPECWSRVWGVWLPRLRGKPYTVLRDLHSVGGAILAPAVGLVAVTGLFFTVVWLGAFNAATGGAGNFPPRLRHFPPSAVPAAAAAPVSVDVAVRVARERFPADGLVVALPKKPADAFAVTARGDGGGPVAGAVAVDQYTGAALSEAHAGQLSPGERARLYALPIHMGTVGGLPTKIIAVVACVGLAGVGVSGIWMWLARRPAGVAGFPRASAARVPRPAAALIVVLAVALPTVGVSLAAVLAGEWLVTRLARRRPATVPICSVPHEVSS